MPITADHSAGVYRIDTPASSLFFIARDGYLFQPWWGARCGNGAPADYASLLTLVPRASFSPPAPGRDWSPDAAPLAWPVSGSGDSRHPALHIRYADGTTASRLEFAGAEISEGLHVPADLSHLSALAGEKAVTLTLHLVDRSRHIEVAVFCSVIEGRDAVITSSRVTNRGTDACSVRTAASACMNLPSGVREQITLPGSWARERQIERQPVRHGERTVGSSRGISGHVFNPFTALVEKNTTENSGTAYGFSLVYSGEFAITAELDQFDALRVSAACGNRDFAWNLEPGESFETPQAVLVYSSTGLGGMSRTYHRLYRDNLCISSWKNRPRPVLVNNWEATYFSFTRDKLESLASASAELGIELFVLDDGWFGKRDSDRSSLGDWVPHAQKLPGGIGELAEAVKRKGMKFGLWFEPEMISADSDLYRAHPDWCIHLNGIAPQESRSQLVLDLARDDVCAHIIDTVSAILSSADIAYVKWDFNRVLTDMGSASLPRDRQGEFAHRFTLGSWSLMRTLVTRFPDILFEGCAGGGGRFDPGVLHFMSQIWTSDDTDARERLGIQYGTSLVYPFSAMAAHVSAVPNHQCGRVTPFAFRAAVAIDITTLSDTEKKEITRQIQNWKKVEHVIRTGDLYRLRSPFEGNETAWNFVSTDRREALLCWYCERSGPNPPLGRLPLEGLDPALRYRVEDFDLTAESLPMSGFPAEGLVFYGADLAGPGIPLPVARSDFSYVIVHFRAV